MTRRFNVRVVGMVSLAFLVAFLFSVAFFLIQDLVETRPQYFVGCGLWFGLELGLGLMLGLGYKVRVS